MAYLIALSPSILHREYELAAAAVTAGRDAASCDIVVTGETMSRQHFRVVKCGTSEFILQDLKSANGVFINHQRIERDLRLGDGDVIGMGSATSEDFRFQLESGRGRPFVMTLPPKPSWSIGRTPANDVPLAANSTVSSLHALIRPLKRPAGDGLEIVDQGSLNGTWVNGRRIRRARLDPADTLMIGSTILRFQLQPDGALHVIRRDCRDEIALEAIGLTYQVGGHGRNGSVGGRRILDQVCLAIQPGEFVGLLGPSGAGKSTLLKALNGYQPPHYGCVLLNETPLYQSFDMFRNSIGYVPQDDIVHAELTVRDSLDYVARLRLPHDVSEQQRADLIDSTIETLGLAHVRKNRLNQLSGGQRKRVSIGCELITRPSVLFLDEPTSGMDPSTEERLMRHFQEMARHGTTILITTHILYNLDLLDRIVIMARGRLVFFGKPAEAMHFFTHDGKPITRPTQIFDTLEADPAFATAGGDPKDAIAAHYQRKYLESDCFRVNIIDKNSGMARDLYEVAARSGGDSATVLRQATAAHRAAPASPAQSAAPGSKSLGVLLSRPARQAGSLFKFSLDFLSPRSFSTLTRRQFAIKLVSLKRTFFYLAVPLILALVTLSLKTTAIPEDATVVAGKGKIRTQLSVGAFNIGNPIKAILSPEGVQDPRPAEDVVYSLKNEGLANLPVPMSVLLMFVMTAVFTGTLMACLDLSTERPIYQRERMAGQKIADYVGSKLPFLLLATALQMALFLGICCLKPGLRQFDIAGVYMALVGMAWASCAMGLFLSALDPSAGQFSVILAIVAVLPQLIFSGGLGPDFFKGMSSGMRALANVFPARWGLEMLMTAFYRHPEHAALGWAEGFVNKTVGFKFGALYGRNLLILLGQGLAWLLLCGFTLKRQDRVR